MMHTTRLFWSKLKWILMLIVALVVVGSAIFLAPHRAVPAQSPVHTATASQASSAPQSSSAGTTCSTLLPQEPPREFATVVFKTDFSKHCVHYSEIFSGGPPKDGIPAINAPKFVSVSSADTWLKPNEPLIFFQVGKEARAYPIQILIWHEIVNDTVGGVPVAVTFCPLCNTAIAFDRTVNWRVLAFGTTGRLRFSNLIMYDRPYGQNPYRGYDNVNQSPFLYSGPPTPGVLPPMARVLIVVLRGEAVAFPFDALKKVHVVNDTVSKTDVVVLWTSGTSSPLDTDTVAGGRDVDAATVYLRTLDGQPLTFKFEGTNIDRQGIIRSVVVGPVDEATLQQKVAEIS